MNAMTALNLFGLGGAAVAVNLRTGLQRGICQTQGIVQRMHVAAALVDQPAAINIRPDHLTHLCGVQRLHLFAAPLPLRGQIMQLCLCGV